MYKPNLDVSPFEKVKEMAPSGRPRFSSLLMISVDELKVGCVVRRPQLSPAPQACLHSPTIVDGRSYDSNFAEEGGVS